MNIAALGVGVVFVFAIASTAANIIGPKILGEATTALFEGSIAEMNGTGSIDFNYIGRIILITLGLYIASAIFSYIMGWIMADISANISYRMGRALRFDPKTERFEDDKKADALLMRDGGYRKGFEIPKSFT